MPGHSNALNALDSDDIVAINELQFQITTLLLETSDTIDPGNGDMISMHLEGLHRGELVALGWCSCLTCWASLIAAWNMTALVRMLGNRDGRDALEAWAEILRNRAARRAAAAEGEATACDGGIDAAGHCGCDGQAAT